MILKWKDRWGKIPRDQRRNSFFVIYDPSAHAVWAADSFTKLEFKAWGDATTSTFNTSREAWLLVRDLILHNINNGDLPINLEVREVHRRDTWGTSKRINTRTDEATAFLRKAEAAYKPDGSPRHLFQALRWMVTRSDWQRWSHATFIGSSDIFEEELAEACEQLNVEAVLIEPYLMTDTYTGAVALKLRFDGLAEITEFKDQLK